MGVTVVAEVGSVHDGSFGNAVQLCALAKSVGADAIKFQMHDPEQESLPGAPRPEHFAGEDRAAYFARTAFTPSQWRELRATVRSLGLQFICSPFSIRTCEFLAELDPDAIKIASGESTHLQLLRFAAQTGNDVVASFGMSSWEEIDRAVEVISVANRVTLLQARSQYPTPSHLVGLNVIRELESRYHMPVGLSDHSRGTVAPCLAVAYGATMIEKHLTFSRHMYGSDAPYATEPAAFSEMVAMIRQADIMVNTQVDKDDLSGLHKARNVYMKSVVTMRNLPSGHVLCEEDLGAKKPGDGTPVLHLADFIGRTLNTSLPANHKLKLTDVL